MKFKEAIQILVGVIILISLIGAILGWSVSAVDKVINFIIPIGISFALSALIGEILERFNLDFLKKIFLVIPIWKFKFSISAFTIIVIILKKWWFG